MSYDKKLTKKVREGDYPALVERLQQIQPIRPVPDKEYENGVYLFDMVECGEVKHDLKYRASTEFAITGDYYNSHSNLKFYFLQIGFEDLKAPLRNWGINIDDYRYFRYENKNVWWLVWGARLIQVFRGIDYTWGRIIKKIRSLSSAGRAFVRHTKGRWFKSSSEHH